MIIITLGILGLILGSFLNVVIYRLPQKTSLAFPGSHCPDCGQGVQWFDNIPVLSYFLLRGKCRSCGSSISFQYPLVEMLTALGFIALYQGYGLTVLFGKYIIYYLFIIPIAFIDMKQKLILNRLTLPCAVLGIIYTLIFDISNWKGMLSGGIAGALILLLVGLIGNWMFKKESLGMGDVKLLGLTGIYLGFPHVLYALFLAMIVAAFFIVGGLVSKRLEMGKTIPFGPFIAIGALGYLLVGNTVLSWYIGLYQ